MGLHLRSRSNKRESPYLFHHVLVLVSLGKAFSFEDEWSRLTHVITHGPLSPQQPLLVPLQVTVTHERVVCNQKGRAGLQVMDFRVNWIGLVSTHTVHTRTREIKYD